MSNRFLALALLVAISAVAAIASVDPDTEAAVAAAEVSQSKDDAVGNTADGPGAKDMAPAASEAVEGPIGAPVSSETLSSMSINGQASAPSPSSAATYLKGRSSDVVAAVVIAAVAGGFIL